MLPSRMFRRCIPNLIMLALSLSLFMIVLSVLGEDLDSLELEPWQGCDIFLAPSETDWGVFAARDFAEGEHVDTSSLSVPAGDERDHGMVKTSVLNDYVYGYDRFNGEYSTIVLHGGSMFFNHHPEPNVQYYKLGSGSVHAMGFFARRAIRAGEQLFSSYGEEDGGVRWFKDRKMDMVAPAESIISSENLPYFLKEFCSKIYGGFGRPFIDRLKAHEEDLDGHLVSPSHLAPFDAGIGNARAKQPIAKGERIEIASGLLISTNLLAGTVLGGLVFSWQHLNEEQRASLRILRESRHIKVQYQGNDNGWTSVDRFVSFEDLSILPASGHIGLVRRVGNVEPSNCRLEILWHLGQRGSVSVTLELRATRDIGIGDVLLLNLPPAGTADELRLLKDELDGMGQPYYPGLFDARSDLDLKCEL